MPLLALVACGGKNGSNPPPAAGAMVTLVSVDPAAASVVIGSSLPFTAVVTGTGPFDSSVVWSVQGVAGGTAAVGTITASGVYVTPYPAPATVTVTAASKTDPGKSASAAVMIGPPPPGEGPDLVVDAAASRHPISPLIYGMNQYSLDFARLATELRLPLERWGGDATTRYNWKLDVTNSANDWYFSTDPNANTGYPDDSEFNDMVARDRATGTLSMGTIPMIGWTTRRERACGFSVAKYGAQKEVNPYNSDCGNGVRPDGSDIIADPTDTSVAIGPDFAKAWVRYLVARYGDAQHGGVGIYSLDNEPELWQWVHRDVHPAYPGYDDLAGLGLRYAAAIKSADPSAQVSGPVTAGWMGYFYSPKDWQSGWNTGPDYAYWGHPVDRQAHGDVPFVEWYLRQFALAERAGGRRLLDLLDVHGYVVPGDIQFQPAGDTANQQERLESVRAFWDPSYRVGGDINAAPNLVPRMKGWVSRNYPGTLTAVTEYNLGALDHINGALAQADLLGVFGRQGLDLATLWAPPAIRSPGFYAFKMLRNYDSAGDGFGDVSVSAISADQSRVSVYASERSADHALTILVLNKTFGDLKSTVAIAGFDGQSLSAVYRYGATTGRITRLPDLPIGARSFSTTFPAASMTMVVVEER
jgi:Glycoside hydrolase family 44